MALSQTQNTTDAEVENEPLVSLLSRHANPNFAESGMTGSTISALLAGYEPLMTTPGCLTGFSRARAGDTDGKTTTLAVAHPDTPGITQPVKVMIGGNPNGAVKALRRNNNSEVLASTISRGACLDIKK
eukprot:CAMPEP_0185577840 /NCGR_PEP_ID=MMETSP0434-20130131/11182_1 /TAXON_ID=626734 ORGANISM="Favella taraikaensis, Strain Fe Narragansett Bay" /NCGR_SAMPLE_ID=MMETSP0434 /ASSEMBLY_ACC=CAM_ASM_000379 /LENGTH=128 /DNA_ID=CAMNT_0028195507 /DNA_START=81 /DNA_END=467 /DNA_ORIENTATION=+